MEGNSLQCSSVQTSKPHECKGKKIKSDDEDRISGLPEPILHHILSFLEMKQVAQASILSKRWRYLWLSVPNLRFHHLIWKRNNKKRKNMGRMGGRRKKRFWKVSFRDFVDKVLLLHNSNIHRFYLSCGDYCNSRKIETWIIAALRRHVKELHIEFSGCAEQLLVVPYSLFISAISVFKFRTNRLRVEAQLPNSLCSAAHLKILELVSVVLPNGDSNGELLLSCPKLEILIIEDCAYYHLKVLNISAFQLKSLVLENYYDWYDCKLRVNAPNLISFVLRGSNCGDCYVEDFSSLVGAHIEANSRLLIKFLKGLYNAKNLTLCCWELETFLGFPHRLEWLPRPFHNLKYLRLINWHDSSCIRAFVDLLESSPYLETLALELALTDSSSTNNGGDWGAYLTSQCMFSSLKFVEIHDIKVCENELKFLEFILKNAVVLEKITITTNKVLSRNREKELEEFYKKLQLLTRASSNITYYFS